MTREQFAVELAVELATTRDGRRRFWPPFEHPAHFRHRQMLEALEVLDPLHRDEHVAEALAYHRSQIDLVEHVQARELQDFIAMTREKMLRSSRPSILAQENINAGDAVEIDLQSGHVRRAR